MKITFSLPVYWPAVGGCEYLTHELVNVLSATEGVDVGVITQIDDQSRKVEAPLLLNTTCRAEKKTRSYRDNGAEVHVLGLNRIFRSTVYPFVRYHHRFQDISTRVIVEMFQRQFTRAAAGSRVIHCIHNGLSYYGMLSLKVARKMTVPFVFSPTLHLYQEGWHEEMVKAIEEGRDFRYIPRLHLWPRGYHDRFWLRLCREADALVTWTSFEKDFLVEQGIDGEKIFPLRLGPIVESRGIVTDLAAKNGVMDDDPVILFLGRNHELKGIEDILKAARKVWTVVPEAKFLFVGPKEGKSGVIFERYRDRRVVVIDEVSSGEKSGLIDRCDVFCVPSLHESFGIVFLEAWHYGKPIIAADIPPIRELNPDNRGGFLIRPTPEEIADRILELLNDDSLRSRMGEWGRKRVQTHYCWDKAGGRLITIYRNLLEREV